MAKTPSFKSLHGPLRAADMEDGRQYPLLEEMADLDLLGGGGISNKRLEAGYVELAPLSPRTGRRFKRRVTKPFPPTEAGLAKAVAHLRELGFEV